MFSEDPSFRPFSGVGWQYERSWIVSMRQVSVKLSQAVGLVPS